MDKGWMDGWMGRGWMGGGWIESGREGGWISRRYQSIHIIVINSFRHQKLVVTISSRVYVALRRRNIW